MSAEVTIKIPPGELVDRVSILLLKLLNADKHVPHVQRELRELIDTGVEAFGDVDSGLLNMVVGLFAVNALLWEAEDKVRDAQDDSEFLEAARAVPTLNDMRSAAKGRINGLLGSSLDEYKVYK